MATTQNLKIKDLPADMPNSGDQEAEICGVVWWGLDTVELLQFFLWLPVT